MKALLLVTLILFMTCTGWAKTSQIILTQDNHVALLGPVDAESINEVILRISVMKANDVYLFLNSPGGSVVDGMRLIDFIQTTPKNITCIAEVAISMAHQILQSCPVRIGTKHNVLMQHRMTSSTSGNTTQMKGFIEVIEKMELELSTMSANRIGLSVAKFTEKIQHEWWTFGKESKRLNIVDSVATIGCNDFLYSHEVHKIVQLQFQKVPVIFSLCPLMPVRVSEEAKNLSPELITAVMAAFNRDRNFGV